MTDNVLRISSWMRPYTHVPSILIYKQLTHAKWTTAKKWIRFLFIASNEIAQQFDSSWCPFCARPMVIIRRNIDGMTENIQLSRFICSTSFRMPSCFENILEINFHIWPWLIKWENSQSSWLCDHYCLQTSLEPSQAYARNSHIRTDVTLLPIESKLPKCLHAKAK